MRPKVASIGRGSVARGLRAPAIVGATLRLFRIAGIPISIHVSWLAIYALITWSLAVGYFPQTLPNGPPTTYWALGLVAALLLFVSVLVHELSHSIVALAHGLKVRGITLHVFGGVSQMDDEPPSPRAEALTAGAGPLASFAIAGVLWALREVGIFDHPSALAIAAYLVTVNVMVGAFNLIPGFPLDGGRLLRALLWRWSDSLPRATYLASRAGVGIAYALMAFGVLQMFGGSVVSGMWLVLIGLFLQSAANASYVQVGLREALERLPVRSIMASSVVTITPDETVAQLVDKFWEHHVASFPVVSPDSGRVLGIASIGQLQRVPREQWSFMRVAELMQPLEASLAVRSTDSALVAFERASNNGIGRLAVIDGERLVGYLSMQDITHVLALNNLGRPGRGAAGADAAPHPLRRVA
jgi:Zn-dependent protease/CBS domain-containing protein